ncbi:MAG: zinc dependent phospholipase C family protein [Oscillospiraceae bacterium]|nr:zinc dependent phospholipase C family protein [Oscillospiraceae bacterium]
MLKLKSITALLLMFIFLLALIPDSQSEDKNPDNQTEHFYIEEMTDLEIEAVIKLIANAEDVVFGDGIGFHGEKYGDSDEWEGDGKNKTHQWLTAVAMEMITNEFTLTSPFLSKNFFKLSASEKATLIQYSDWPDIYETKDVNSWHFYYGDINSPHYGTNYWRNHFDDHTAKSRFIHWYNSAVSKYRNHSRVDAYRDLGKALHYLQDLNAPPHTGDNTVNAIYVVGKHQKYEQTADERKAEFRVTSGGLYTHHVANTLSSVADTAARYSYGYYDITLTPPMYTDSMYANMGLPLQRSQRDTAGLIYRFFRDVSAYDHDDHWCDEGIVYDDSKDVIVHGSRPGFEINLTKNTIRYAPGYQPKAYSPDGESWKEIKANRNGETMFDDVNFAKTLRKKFKNLSSYRMHLSNKEIVKKDGKKKPPEDAEIIDFPTIRRGIPYKTYLFVNYKTAAEDVPANAPAGAWWLVFKSGEVVPKEGLEVAVGMREGGKLKPDEAKYGRLCINHNIAVKPLPDSGKQQKITYYIRQAARYENGEYITGSNARSKTVSSQRPKPKVTINEKKDNFKVKADMYVTIRGQTTFYDKDAVKDKTKNPIWISRGQTAEIWLDAIAKRPVSEKLLLRY